MRKFYPCYRVHPALPVNRSRDFIVTPIHPMPARLPAHSLAAIAAGVFLLSSCGGGGGDSATTANVAAPAAPATASNVAQVFTGPAGADGWTQCADEGEVCATPGVRQVRYGGDGKFAYLNVDGPVGCNNAAFGDPAFGVVKRCQYAAPGTVAGRQPKGHAAVPNTQIAPQPDTKIDFIVYDFKIKPAVLGQTALSNIHLRQQLDARGNRCCQVSRWRIGIMLQHAVHPVTDAKPFFHRLKMNVGGSQRDTAGEQSLYHGSNFGGPFGT